METLKYFKDIANNFLLAYEKSTEFFVMYNFEKEEWTYCDISFLQFRHDYIFVEISKEEIQEATKGNLPQMLFEQYQNMLKRNSNL